jgi:hypothetical protein
VGVWILVLAICGCPSQTSKLMVGPPSFEGLLQEFLTEVDEGDDGSLEASDVGSLTAGASDPGTLSTSASTQQVSFSAESDHDSILTHCEHVLTAGTSRTACTGTVRGEFVPAETGTARFYVAAVRSPGPSDTPSGLTDSVNGRVVVDCGQGSVLEVVDQPAAGVGVFDKADIEVEAEEGVPCLVTIEHTATASAASMPVGTSLIQTVSVTGQVLSSSPECTRSDQCPAEAPVCDADGVCGTGDEGQPGLIASIHCQTPFVAGSPFVDPGCSWGVSGSACRGDFECQTDAGYTCSANVCVGSTACSSDGDCPPEAPYCSDQGTCSPHGEQGDGCVTGDFCRQGLICLSKRCTVILGEGGDCTQPFTTCDGPYACFPSTNTCETPRPLGSICTADVECAAYPVDNSCNQAIGGGVCAERQSSGGPCADNLDCQGFAGCDTGTGTCN